MTKIKTTSNSGTHLSIQALLLLFSIPLATVGQSQIDPHDLLRKSINAIGLGNLDSNLKYEVTDRTSWDYQSDRSYPPFLSFQSIKTIEFDTDQNVEAISSWSIYPSFGPTEKKTYLNNGKSEVEIGDDKNVEVLMGTGADPFLNPMAILLDWSKRDRITYSDRAVYRDFERIVLVSENNNVEELLFIDPETYYPVKLELHRKHYLYGTVKVEYLFTTWWFIDGTTISLPLASFKLVDGREQISRIVGSRSLVDSRVMIFPNKFDSLESEIPIHLQELPTDTIRVSSDIYLIENRGYTNCIVSKNEKVYLLDAPQGAMRAKSDHDWIKKIFPESETITIVVTDLAWPHIAGIRYWVSQGAKIVTHEKSIDFLTKVIERNWTRSPDLLEKQRQAPEIIGVDNQFFPDDGIKILPIDGIGTEGALMVFTDEAFLWCGDFIQTTNSPSLYARDIFNAVKKYNLKPEIFAAQHTQLTEWKVISTLFQN